MKGCVAVRSVTLLMALKDYYSILGVLPGAGNDQIKRAYRKLAMEHHPDRNKEDPYAVARFHEIKEAYDTLTDPVRKDHYLQQRWYAQSLGKKFAEHKPVTPETLLSDVIQLNKYVHSLNAFRVDKEGLTAYILNVINENTLSFLSNYNVPDTKREIARLIIDSLGPLENTQIIAITEKLKRLTGNDKIITELIIKKVTEKRSAESFRKYEVVILLLITAIVCFLIWRIT
jgi:molecular chaperone DnaJ